MSNVPINPTNSDQTICKKKLTKVCHQRLFHANVHVATSRGIFLTLWSTVLSIRESYERILKYVKRAGKTCLL